MKDSKQRANGQRKPRQPFLLMLTTAAPFMKSMNGIDLVHVQIMVSQRHVCCPFGVQRYEKKLKKENLKVRKELLSGQNGRIKMKKGSLPRGKLPFLSCIFGWRTELFLVTPDVPGVVFLSQSLAAIDVLAIDDFQALCNHLCCLSRIQTKCRLDICLSHNLKFRW